jgi:hypothetical protein
MKTSYILACLIIFGLHNSVEAQSPLPVNIKPFKSKITLYSGPDKMIGALLLLKDSSILVSSSLVKEDYYNGNYEVAELYIDDINMISPKGRVGPGGAALIGAAIGFSIGASMGLIGGDYDAVGGLYDPTPGGIAIMTGIGIGVIGAVAGAIIGIKIKIPIKGSMENYNRKKKKLGRYTVKYDGSPKY